MGELAASLAHEINQPITAAIAYANACLRWLDREEPDLGEVRSLAVNIVGDGQRAARIIAGARMSGGGDLTWDQHVKKTHHETLRGSRQLAR
ncbi:histidine kinase dimerization/phospho-acceptor domain-containing protein [Caballeronia sp. KNU42]